MPAWLMAALRAAEPVGEMIPAAEAFGKAMAAEIASGDSVMSKVETVASGDARERRLGAKIDAQAARSDALERKAEADEHQRGQGQSHPRRPGEHHQ